MAIAGSLAALVALGACSMGCSTGAPVANLLSCGDAAPYVPATGIVTKYDPNPYPGAPGALFVPFPGVSVHTSTCDAATTSSATTNLNGVYNELVSTEHAFFHRFTADGFVTVLSAELTGAPGVLPGNSSPNPTFGVGMFARGAAGLPPGYDAGKPLLLVSVDPRYGSNACAVSCGVTFSGVPGASIVYQDDACLGGDAGAADAGSSPTFETATITGLPAGVIDSLTGTKPGCLVDFSQNWQTGRVTLESGAITIVFAYLLDAPPSDAGVDGDADAGADADADATAD